MSKCMGVRADGDVEMVSFNLPAGHNQDQDSPSFADDFPPDISTHHSQFKDYYAKVYPGASRTYRRGPNFMDKFDGDEHAAMWKENLYYPWASWSEWELISFLLHSSLSMTKIDQFLSLDPVDNDKGEPKAEEPDLDQLEDCSEWDFDDDNIYRSQYDSDEYSLDEYKEYIRGSERSYDSSGDEPTIQAAHVNNGKTLESSDEINDP